MPLAVGDKLGQYEILSLLVKGGMEEVHRGRNQAEALYSNRKWENGRTK
jgi:hypothetical protein